MSYQIEDVNGCTKKLSFNFENLDLSTEVKSALVKKQKTVSLKGFRKGKAPLSVVEKMYGPQVENEALNSFIQNQLYEAVSTEDLRVVGYPNLENMNYEPGQKISFDAVIEIFPKVEVSGLESISVTKDKVEYNDDDLEQAKKNYLNNKAEMKEIEDDSVALDKGMFAVMNFEGEKADGEKPENMKGDEFLLEIGSNQFIPGFEEQMVGMKKGEKKTLSVTFPKDYQATELQDADVKFHVELLEIKEKNYPEFSDELAKEFGFDSVADFEQKNKKNILDQREREAKQKLNQEIIEKLVEKNKFDIPEALVTQQKNHLKEDVTKNLQQQGFNEAMMEDYFTKWADDMNEKATFQVRSGLILDSFAKEHNIEADQADFDKKLDEVAGSSGLGMDQIKSFYEKDERMKNNLMFAIREEKTFDKMHDMVTVK